MFPTFKLSYQATFFIVSPDRPDDSSPAVLSKEMGKIAGLLSKFPTYCPKEILMVYMMQVSIFLEILHLFNWVRFKEYSENIQ